MNILTKGLTQNNLKSLKRSCRRCGKYFPYKKRVDCINLKGTEISFCMKHYNLETSKPDTLKEIKYWEMIKSTKKTAPVSKRLTHELLN